MLIAARYLVGLGKSFYIYHLYVCDHEARILFHQGLCSVFSERECDVWPRDPELHNIIE